MCKCVLVWYPLAHLHGLKLKYFKHCNVTNYPTPESKTYWTVTLLCRIEPNREFYEPLIICICIYIVAKKIVACRNWNVITSSPWLTLDKHGEIVFTIHVRRDPPHSNNPDHPSFEWECNVTGQPIWFRPLKWTFLTCFSVVVFVQQRRWLSSSDITFLRKSQGLVKRHSQFIQALCTLLWIDCFETYMEVT